jgi:hypothetical protein
MSSSRVEFGKTVRSNSILWINRTMAEKNITDLSSFDFGFSVVDADELDVVQSVRQEVASASDTASQWQEQADEWKAKANAIYNAVMPLLNNLQSNEEKEYIYWPNRTIKIDQFKLKLQQVLND